MLVARLGQIGQFPAARERLANVIDAQEAQGAKELAFVKIELVFVALRSVSREQHQQTAENLLAHGFGVAHRGVRYRPEEVGLGTVEELLHQHSCDAIITAANGIAAEMNEAFGGQEIGGSRIRDPRAPPRKRRPVTAASAGVDLRLDRRRAAVVSTPFSFSLRSTDVPYRPLSAASCRASSSLRPALHQVIGNRRGDPESQT